jgi:hypothetical protein
MKKDARELGRICQGMEDAGIEINSSNYHSFLQIIST